MRKILYTFSSNKKNIFYTAMFILIFIAIIFIVGLVLEQMFEYNTRFPTYHSSNRWDDFYSFPDDSFDLVFLGTSHCAYSYVPEVFNKELGVNAYNMGSMGQRMDTTYYLTREVMEHHEPDVIVLDIFSEVLKRDRWIYQVKYNYMHMKDSDIKKDMWKDCFNLKDKIEYSIKLLRYRTDLWRFLTNYLNKHRPPHDDHHTKIHDGHLKNDKVVDINDLRYKNAYGDSCFDMTDDWQMEYLDKIVDLCKQNNIELVLVTAPMPPLTFSTAVNYEDYNCYINDYAHKNGLEFIDFNIINQEQHLFSNKMFFDSDHMNFKGAGIVSKHLAQNLEHYFSE